MIDAAPTVGADEGAAPLVRVRLDLSYDGTDFAGWAMQPGLRTVEGSLGEALGKIVRLGRPARMIVAGRTDAGVHARAQTVHVDLPLDGWASVPGRSDRSPAEALLKRLSGVLPNDIAVREVREIGPEFDARFSALRRWYRYRIVDRLADRDPLRRRDVVWYRHELDVEAMAAASEKLLGENDFVAFCRPREGSSTIRTLEKFEWTRIEEGPESGLIVATVQADAFCHNMVRALVGGVIPVGEGKRDISWPIEVLRTYVRHPSVTVMPAHGLTLEGVEYPEDAQGWEQRSIQSRAVRGPLYERPTRS